MKRSRAAQIWGGGDPQESDWDTGQAGRPSGAAQEGGAAGTQRGQICDPEAQCDPWSSSSPPHSVSIAEILWLHSHVRNATARGAEARLEKPHLRNHKAHPQVSFPCCYGENEAGGECEAPAGGGDEGEQFRRLRLIQQQTVNPNSQRGASSPTQAVGAARSPGGL